MAPTDTHLEEALACIDDQDSVKRILEQCDDAERGELASYVQLAHTLRAHRHDLDPSHELLSQTLAKFQKLQDQAITSNQKASRSVWTVFRTQPIAMLLIALIAFLGGYDVFRNTPQRGSVAVQIPITNEPNSVTPDTAAPGALATNSPQQGASPQSGTIRAPMNAPQNPPQALDTSALAALAGNLGNDLNSYDQDVVALQELARDQTLATASSDMTTVTQL